MSFEENKWQKVGACIWKILTHVPYLPAFLHEPGSKLLVLGMVIPPLIGNPCNWYINPYYWVDFPIPYYMEISWEFTVDPIAHINQHPRNEIFNSILSSRKVFSEEPKCLAHRNTGPRAERLTSWRTGTVKMVGF